MKAAEKIPKKLYVYLDTTRGLHKRNGCKNVHHLRPRYSLRHHRQRDIWADTLHFGRIIMSRKSKKARRSAVGRKRCTERLSRSRGPCQKRSPRQSPRRHIRRLGEINNSNMTTAHLKFLQKNRLRQLYLRRFLISRACRDILRVISCRLLRALPSRGPRGRSCRTTFRCNRVFLPWQVPLLTARWRQKAENIRI